MSEDDILYEIERLHQEIYHLEELLQEMYDEGAVADE